MGRRILYFRFARHEPLLKPYKGVIVTPLTRKDVEELYSVRTALELLALDYSIDRMSEAEIDHLDEIVDHMRLAAKDNDLQRLVEVDLRFHEYLLEQAGHELALRLWRTLEVSIRRSLHTRHQIYTFLDEVVGSHPTLITALRQRNKTLAKQIMSDHVAESVLHVLANWPDDPEPNAEHTSTAEPTATIA